MYIVGAMRTGGCAYHNLWHCCNGRERQSHHSRVHSKLICIEVCSHRSTEYTQRVHVLPSRVLTQPKLVNRAEENTITVNEETNKSCQVSVTPSRVMSKKVKKAKLNFVMKDPQVRGILDFFAVQAVVDQQRISTKSEAGWRRKS